MIHKRILFLVSLFLVACSNNNYKNKTIVSFYNCENFFDTVRNPLKNDSEFTPTGKYKYNTKIYAQKLRNIATVIQSMEDDKNNIYPAIIGLAEIENKTVLYDLVNQPEIIKFNYKYILYDGNDERGINVALIYNSTYFHILSSETIPVNITGFGGKENTRDILYVNGILKKDTIHVFVNHWPSRTGGTETSELKRIKAAQTLKNKTDSIFKNNPNANIIVMGDFNDNPTDKSLNEILKAGELKQVNQFYNPYLSLYKAGLGTEKYGQTWNLFDQILISGNLTKNKLLRFENAIIYKPDFLCVHRKENEGTPLRSFIGNHWLNGFSDHFPVVMYFVE